MYSQGDVEDILDGLKACVITNLHQEVMHVLVAYSFILYRTNLGHHDSVGLLYILQRQRVKGNWPRMMSTTKSATFAMVLS